MHTQDTKYLFTLAAKMTVHFVKKSDNKKIFEKAGDNKLTFLHRLLTAFWIQSFFFIFQAKEGVCQVN